MTLVCQSGPNHVNDPIVEESVQQFSESRLFLKRLVRDKEDVLLLLKTESCYGIDAFKQHVLILLFSVNF